MPRVTFNRMKTKKSSVKKRRSSTLLKARYKPKTSRANRSLIKSNAYAIRSIRRLLPRPIWTDWQYSGTLHADSPDDSRSFTLSSIELMSPYNPQAAEAVWQPVLRQDVNVVESSQTRVLRMQLNLRYRLNDSNWCQFSVFVVTIRRDAVNTVPNQAHMVEGRDYITNLGDDFGVRLNPASFKVHYTRNISLMKNGWMTPPQTFAGGEAQYSSESTFAKGQVNIKLGLNLKQPNSGLSWTALDQSSFAPHMRYFFMVFMVQQNNLPGTANAACVNFDNLYTCYNSG